MYLLTSSLAASISLTLLNGSITKHLIPLRLTSSAPFLSTASKEDLGGDKWNQIADHCNSNFYHIDMERYTLESVLKKGAELVKRKGIKCLVIDPFNKVRDIDCKTEDVNRYTMEYLSKIKYLLRSMMY